VLVCLTFLTCFTCGSLPAVAYAASVYPAIASAAGPRPVDATGAGRERARPAVQVVSGVTYTPGTVVVPRSVVSAELIGIGRDGTFRFKSAAGPLAKLKVGSVMLLEGSAAGTVTALQDQNGELVVTTKDAPLTAIVSSGSISFSGVPEMSQAFVAPIDQPGETDAAPALRFEAQLAPAHPRSARSLVPASSGPTLSLQGGAGGPFGYSVTAEPTGPSSLHLSGTLCYGHGDICANGPASGISLEVSFDGNIDVSNISGQVGVQHGAINKLQAAFDGLKSNIKVSYTFSRGEGADGTLTFPAFHIPLGVDIPIPGPIPLFARVQLGLLLQVLSKPGKNTVSHGAMEGRLAGSGNVADGSGGSSASGAGASGIGSVSAGTAGLGISPGVLGIVVATQIKVGIAVGVTVADLLAYTDLIGSIGQEQASAIGGGFCSSYIGVLTWGAGIEAQLGGGALGIAAGKKWELKNWDFNFTEPGCRKISA
jgi:hypothetical protein